MGNKQTKSVRAEADIDRKDPLDDTARLSSPSNLHDLHYVDRKKVPTEAEVSSCSLEPTNSSGSSKSLITQQGSPTSISSKLSAGLNAGQRASSKTSELCSICLDALANIPENGATQHHMELLSLEESVRSGCHLCSLIRHFLPGRQRRLSNEGLTLSLRWDGSSSGSL